MQDFYLLWSIVVLQFLRKKKIQILLPPLYVWHLQIDAYNMQSPQ